MWQWTPVQYLGLGGVVGLLVIRWTALFVFLLPVFSSKNRVDKITEIQNVFM